MHGVKDKTSNIAGCILMNECEASSLHFDVAKVDHFVMGLVLRWGVKSCKRCALPMLNWACDGGCGGGACIGTGIVLALSPPGLSP